MGKKQTTEEKLPVIVITRDMADNVLTEKEVSFNSRTRRWLVSHIIWALNNQMSVELIHKTDLERHS